jgi:hypothetical protein
VLGRDVEVFASAFLITRRLNETANGGNNAPGLTAYCCRATLDVDEFTMNGPSSKLPLPQELSSVPQRTLTVIHNTLLDVPAARKEASSNPFRLPSALLLLLPHCCSIGLSAAVLAPFMRAVCTSSNRRYPASFCKRCAV